MKIHISKSDIMVLDWKNMACPFWLGRELLPQVVESKYLVF